MSYNSVKGFIVLEKKEELNKYSSRAKSLICSLPNDEKIDDGAK
ncbi:hypothetical protein OMAG_001050 [Candidatus Omnitrophus magneticus]|uniref:Uncharacterized protein n=1 Tax=Candidatus Omnitrophus magneticus TaxID=1609969 RepID=A0A0F0CU69_9BACT|nr:hypothetical protein OMAG_001050 [Candidatus Omnitrophus magneticus]